MVSLPFFIGMWYNTGKIFWKGMWAVRTIYIDQEETAQSGALVIVSGEVQIMRAGTVFHTEQDKVRAEVPQYQEMAERAGVFFFFEDEELPEIPFYAVPSLELVARDREGNWYGRSEDLGEGVYCVTPEGAAFRVSERMGRFSSRLLAGEEVRELWEPVPELRVYPSKAEAAREVELVPLEELLPKGWKERER